MSASLQGNHEAALVASEVVALVGLYVKVAVEAAGRHRRVRLVQVARMIRIASHLRSYWRDGSFLDEVELLGKPMWLAECNY